jgi:hypothetical protein
MAEIRAGNITPLMINEMKKAEVTKVSLYSHVLMALTTIHHIYGAIIYNTPWRLHVLMISIPVIVVTALLNRLLAGQEYNRTSFLFLLYCAIILVPSIGLIGFFEGIYNHALKDLLYFAGASREKLLQLFPPPKYRMPDDFWFEFTGVLQAVVVIPLTIHFIRLTKIMWYQPAREN